MHGIEAENVTYTSYAGRTDGAIARDLLVNAGVETARIDAELARVQTVTSRRYDELCPADLSPLVADGIADLLAELAGLEERFRLSLLTGNFEPVARLKLERAGIGSFFEPGQGGFGSDAEAREELPPLARARAGDWPRERTIVIGDTPNDIACARADGLRVIAVTTGPFGAGDLAGADHVASGAGELRPLLSALAA